MRERADWQSCDPQCRSLAARTDSGSRTVDLGLPGRAVRFGTSAVKGSGRFRGLQPKVPVEVARPILVSSQCPGDSGNERGGEQPPRNDQAVRDPAGVPMRYEGVTLPEGTDRHQQVQ